MGSTTTHDPAASIQTRLMDRKVCGSCGHLHRQVLVRKCDCCRDDIQGNYPHDAVPLVPGVRRARCRVCDARCHYNDDGVLVHTPREQEGAVA